MRSIVVEVLSPSTADADFGPKLGRYTAIPSVREIWIADPGRPLVYQFSRPADEGDDWRVRATTALDADLHCEAFGIDVAMADLYALVLGVDGADGPGNEAVSG